MTQVQDMQKRYSTPALTVYGRLEDVTLLWSNPTSTDNSCPGVIGSQNLNSGALCVVNRRSDDGSDAIVDPSVDTTVPDAIVDPLSQDLTGSAGS